MSQYIQNMNETYIKKHFPKRSVFEGVVKSTKKIGIGIYLFFGALLVGSLAGLMWSVNAMNEYRQSGDIEMADTGRVICIVFAVVTLIAVLCLAITIWRGKQSSDDWLAKSAQNSKLSESRIREFEQQAMAPDSYILKFLSGVNATLSGSKDGILTQDYIFLSDLNLTVLRCEDIICACLVEASVSAGKLPSRMQVDYLYLKLLSKDGVQAITEVSPEAGGALLEILLQKNTNIECFDGKVISESKYDKYMKSKLPVV